MASSHIDRYDDLTLQIAHQAQRSADLYADDARRAYQRRVDTVSMAEATATQQLNTDKIAQSAVQSRVPIVVPGPGVAGQATG